jgi:hypothetical protein
VDTFSLRAGAAAGWLAFVGVAVGLVAIPMAIAGQPPTISSSTAEVRAYFGHGELAMVETLSPIIAIAMLPFALALRAVLRPQGGPAAFASEVGLLAIIVAVPLYVVSSALGAALVHVAGTGGAAFDVLFRTYSVLYDGAADFLEGAWVGAFALAMTSLPATRWVGWLGLAVAASRFVKALAPVVPLPDALAIVGGIAFLVWLAAVVIWLTRASASARLTAAAPVPAAG